MKPKTYRDQDDAELGEPLIIQFGLFDPTQEGWKDMPPKIVRTIVTDIRMPALGSRANPYRDAD